MNKLDHFSNDSYTVYALTELMDGAPYVPVDNFGKSPLDCAPYVVETFDKFGNPPRWIYHFARRSVFGDAIVPVEVYIESCKQLTEEELKESVSLGYATNRYPQQ